MNKIKGLFGLSLAMAITACGPAKVAVKPEAVTQISELALVRIAEPPAYVANDFGNPGMMFGAVGGAVAGASSENTGKNVDQLASEAGFRAGERLTEGIRAGLEASGYRVRIVEAPRTAPGKLLQGTGGVEADDADAILDVAIESAGYATEHPMFSPHWRPAAQVRVALLDRRSGQPLYGEKFMYGYHNPLLSGTDLDAPEAYQFKDKDALFANRETLIAGMAHAMDSVADAIVSNLKK
jgi:hypothetical protein